MTVFLVATLGKGSLDLYSMRLARYLDVPVIRTDIYQRVFERFNKPLLSLSTLDEIRETWQFARKMDAAEGIPHFPSHHFGRVGFMMKKPFIITVHDLIRYFDMIGYGPLIHRPNVKDRFWLNLDYHGVKKAAKIIVPSGRTKLDLMKFLGVPEDKIRVIYHGVDEVFKPTKGWRPCEEPYVLFVGSEHPRKNLTTLLIAFGKLKKEYPEFRDVKLVKAGRIGGGEEDFRRRTLELIKSLGIEKDVVFVDWISQESLASMYTNAEVFAFPSLYEGFGWPPVEAMACGCPVISSNTSCMPEILGDAALYVNPRDVDGWKEALALILSDSNLRRKLTSRALERAKFFTWERAAKETLEVYREVEEQYSHKLKLLEPLPKLEVSKLELPCKVPVSG